LGRDDLRVGTNLRKQLVLYVGGSGSGLAGGTRRVRGVGVGGPKPKGSGKTLQREKAIGTGGVVGDGRDAVGIKAGFVFWMPGDLALESPIGRDQQADNFDGRSEANFVDNADHFQVEIGGRRGRRRMGRGGGIGVSAKETAAGKEEYDHRTGR
jgi:hypothetical protein